MNLLSVYYAPGHNRPGDLDYIRRLRPSVCRILEPDVSAIASVHAASPQTLIMPRYWWLDDGNREQYAAMVRDPVGTGKRHAGEWQRELTRLRREAAERGLIIPAEMIVTGVNEPDTNQSEMQTVEYNHVFLSELAERGIRGGALCLSVGHPTRLRANKIVDWGAYMRLEDTIRQGRHYVVLHEYWQQEGPFHGDDWGFLAGRHHACPFNAPIIIGEAGIDGAIYNRHPRNTGWREFVDPQQFADQVLQYCERADPRVVGVCLFLTDYKDNNWASFDTEPAHEQLEQVAQLIRQVSLSQVTWAKPTGSKSRPTGTYFVNAPAGLNLRKSPTTDGHIIRELQHGERVQVSAWFGEWAEIDDLTQWAHGAYLSQTQPEPVIEPEPQPTNNWERSYAFTARWEGGYQNLHNDKGNWTGGQVGVGELKGTNWGISAASYPHLDIRNLTKEQAKAIYFRDYWQASGAEKLDWPACLIVFDTAVLHGVGRARQWVQEAGTNPLHLAARRLRSYMGQDNWHFWGAAWTRRVADLLDESAT